MTGPGLPFFSRLKARRITGSTSLAWLRVSTDLTTEAKARAELNRGKTCAWSLR